jgi:ABC-type oligopeptide transport system substrate-binding subunit
LAIWRNSFIDFSNYLDFKSKSKHHSYHYLFCNTNFDAFTKDLILKMEAEPDDKPVPDHYIENELKKYLNDNYDVDPQIPLKED